MKYREEIVEKQLVLDRLTTAAIALFTATAVLSRMEKEGETAEGIWYFRQMMEKMQGVSSGLFHPGDKEINSLSDHLTGL